MSRRAALPGADELFRATSSAAAVADAVPVPAEAAPDTATQAPQGASGRAMPLRRVPAEAPRPSGREGHDQKITVYLSADELVALDEAKSALFRDHQLKVDRGRIVREAVAVVLADLAAKGDHGILVRRLREG
jgi:hypothetical protein